MILRKLGAACALALALPTAGQAVTYNIVSSFAVLPAVTVPFSYGYRVGTGPFVAYDRSTSTCAGITGLACDYASDYNNNSLPAVGLNQTAALISTGTVRIPTNELFLHPVGTNSGLLAGDTIVRFTALNSGTYQINGLFQLLDTSPSGVNIGIEGGTSTFGQYLAGPLNTQAAFNFTTALSIGQTLDFVVNSAGSYYNDSTGLAGTITSVPEAATWAMMVGGFGLMGAAMRRRRPSALTA